MAGRVQTSDLTIFSRSIVKIEPPGETKFERWPLNKCDAKTIAALTRYRVGGLVLCIGAKRLLNL